MQKGIGQLQPLDLYRAVEPRYDAIIEDNNAVHFSSKKVMDDISREDISQWCTVKTDLQNYLPKVHSSLDAGCGNKPRGTVGFDLQSGTSYRQALDVYQENQFEVVTSYGSIHSPIGTKRRPWLETTSAVTTDDPLVLWERNPLVTLQQYTVDRGLIAFHLSCLVHWSSDYIGFTIRSRHCDFSYLASLADLFKCDIEKQIVVNEEAYISQMIDYYNNYNTEDRLTLLKKLYIIKNHYVNDPPIGIVWRKYE